MGGPGNRERSGGPGRPRYDFVSGAFGLKTWHGGTDLIPMGERLGERSVGRSRALASRVPDRLGFDDRVLRAPTVRRDAVARARGLLQGKRWCRAEEVASTLVDCLVGGRMP